LGAASPGAQELAGVALEITAVHEPKQIAHETPSSTVAASLGSWLTPQPNRST
jgi:hypothetical protein